MKLRFNNFFSALTVLFFIGNVNCKEVVNLQVNTLKDIDSSKKFVLYDALPYKGKPDLTLDGFTRQKLIYEGFLTKQDPNDSSKIILDMDKIKTQAEAIVYSKTNIINTDIETWYGDRSVSGEELERRLTVLFDVFKSIIPNAEISNYGIAPSALCVYRYYDNAKTDEATLLNKWRVANEKRWITSKAVDFFSPSVYIAEPNIESWIKDLKITVQEIKAHDASKKIIVYLWPQYYDKKGSPYFKKYIASEIWEKMLEAVYENCDGAILWSSTTDEKGQTVSWSDNRVQTMYAVTKKFIAEHKIENNELTTTQPVVKNEISSFSLFSSIKYRDTPSLVSFGIHEYQYVSETVLSSGVDANGICIPDSINIAKFSKSTLKHPDRPICILDNTWIKDRTSNNSAMVSRYEMIHRIFKANNNKTKLSFNSVGSTSLNLGRLSEGRSEEQIIDSWFRYSVNPLRQLKQYADILLLQAYIINDDTTTWKRDFSNIIKEAKYKNTQKPVYACFWTQYFNRKDAYPFFQDANKPIKYSTWLTMLETAYLNCDGVVILSNSQNTTQSQGWSFDFDFWRATEDFMKKHKKVILK